MVWYWGLTRFHSIRVPVFLLVMICGSVICRWARNIGGHGSSKMPDLSLSAAPIFCDILPGAPLRISSSSWQRMKPNKTKQKTIETNKQTIETNKKTKKRDKWQNIQNKTNIWRGVPLRMVLDLFLVLATAQSGHRFLDSNNHNQRCFPESQFYIVKNVQGLTGLVASSQRQAWQLHYITSGYWVRLQSTQIFSGSKYPNWWNDCWVTLPEMWRQTERNQFQLCHRILFRQILNLFMQRI